MLRIENNENIDLIQFSSPKYPIKSANETIHKSNNNPGGILFPNKQFFNNSNNWTDSSAYTSENNSTDSNELTSSINGGAESPTLLKSSTLYDKSILPLNSESVSSLNTHKTTNDFGNANNDTIKHTNDSENKDPNQNNFDTTETDLDVVDFIEVSNDCINVDQEDFW